MKNRNLVILFFTMVVVMLSFGIIIPILPSYIESFGGGGLAMGGLMAIFSLLQFFFSPVWGAVSDRYGRKPVLTLGAIGNGLGLIVMGLASDLPSLYLGRAVGGILSSATLPTAMAFISDSTDEKQRGGGMGIIGAAMGLGMILGPGIGGTTANISTHVPFFIGAGLSFLAAILTWVYLPESLPVEKRQHDLKIRGPQFAQMWGALFGPLGFLLILAFLHNFAMTNFEGIFGFYTQRRFDYTPQTIGVVLTFVGIASTIVQGVLTGPATRRFGDVAVIKASLIASVGGFLVMLTANSLITVILTTGIFTLSNAMLRPSVSSLISKRAKSGQGMAMGLNNAYMSLGRVIGPLWAGMVLDINLSFPFLSGALIMLAGFVASLFFLFNQQINEDSAGVEAAPIQIA
jgi:DHA1 family multidrug resistance protein-like MFS transporter